MQKDENSTSVKETQSRQEQCKGKCAWNLTTQQTKMNPPMSDPETNEWLFCTDYGVYKFLLHFEGSLTASPQFWKMQNQSTKVHGLLQLES